MIAYLFVLLSIGAGIQGTVRTRSSLEPIPGAVVTIPELKRTVTADARGYFVISDVPEGRWNVEASALGHATHALTVVSTGTGVIRIDFELAVEPVRIRDLEVRGGQAGEDQGGVRANTSAGPPAVRVDVASLRLQPGLAEPDVLRALQVLPAVGSISDLSSALYVRGGASDQNLITLDNIPLFNPYHLGGIFSAISAGAVSRVDVWAGAQPARAPGDRLSSTVAIHSRDGGRDQLRGEGAIGLISAHGVIDGPLPGRKGSYLLAGRRTYIDPAIAAANKLGLTDFRMPYGFSDLYGKATHSVGLLGTVSASAYLNSESIDFPESMRTDSDGDLLFNWGSRMFSVGYRQALNAYLLLDARAGYSDFHGSFDWWDSDFATEPPAKVLDGRTLARDLLVGVDLTWYRPSHTLLFGLQSDNYLFEHRLESDSGFVNDSVLLQSFNRAARERTVAAYVEGEFQLSDDFDLRVGLRHLGTDDLGNAWLPRAALRWKLGDYVAVSASAGRFAQAIRSMRNDESYVASILAYDLLTAQEKEAGLSRGDEVTLGAEWARGASTIRLDAYAKRMNRLVLPHTLEAPLDMTALTIDEYRIGTGSVRGLELLASHRVGETRYMLSYALTRSSRRVGSDVYIPRFERRHMLDATAITSLGQSGVFSTRVSWGSGQPFTPVETVVVDRTFDPATGTWRYPNAAVIVGTHNSDRLPAYFRVDVAARKQFTTQWFGRETKLSPYVQVLNLFNTHNVMFGELMPAAEPRLQYTPQLPILPTFGIEWRF